MRHVDALSRSIGVMVVEDNSFESNLIASQNIDKNIVELREKLQETEDKLYEMRNGIIYRKRNDSILFYVPSNMENNIIRKYHDELGHFCAEKTSEAILRNYWFPQLKDKVKTYITNCLKCIAFSPITGKKEGYLNSIPKGDIPFLTCHIDHFGPIDKNISSKKYILLVIDGFTKFTKLYAVKTTNSKETIDCLFQYFRNYSRPKTIVSDRGTSFTSDEFKSFMEENNVKHVLVATASPKANGQVERVNRALGPALAKLSDPTNGKIWFKMLSDVEFSLNNVVHSVTGITPSKLLFGVNQRGKTVDYIAEQLEENTHDEDRNMERIRTEASEKISKAQEYNKKYFDGKRKKPYQYEVDDLVVIRNFDSTVGSARKLIPQYKGPYRVIKKLRNDRYVLSDLENFQVTQKPYVGTWEVSNMKPWHSDFVALLCECYAEHFPTTAQFGAN